MSEVLRRVRDFFVSLRLTVVLLALGIVLVFWATWAQVDLGVWGVQQRFFHTLLVIERIPGTPLWAPFPGGYAIGGLLLLNLIAAHVYRFKLTWRKLGIQLTHLGLILLLVGELLSGLWQEDYSMQIANGETKNYAESLRENELAIVDVTDPKTDEVVAIPEDVLAHKQTIQHPVLPFRVTVKAYYPNADFVRRAANGAGAAGAPHATAGMGLQFDAVPLPITYKQDDRNLPAAYVELTGASGPIGTWLVFAHPNIPPQHFEYGGRSWKIALRYRRVYEPFSLTLLKFSHDVYPGTDIPKNFSSLVRLDTGNPAADRDVRIYMNNPLRYAGLTFYQADYDHEKDQYTVLQVVRNPSWLMPYIACTVMALGLVLQFALHLLGFIKKRRAALVAASA